MMKSNIILTILSLFILTAVAEGKAKKEFTREIHKEFDISSDGTFEVINKYGDLNIETTSGSNIVIDVLIEVQASSETKAQDIFDRIDIDFSNSNQYVKAETEISNKRSGWFKGWWGNSGKNSYKINYTIKMPKTCQLQITNKYGDSFVGDLENDVDVNVRYGSIQMRNISGELDLDMKYAKGSIASAGEADFELGYSNLKVGQLGDLDLYSSYSDLEVEEMGLMDVSSKYSDIIVDQMQSLEAESKYDDFEIGSLHEVEVDGRYTTVEVGTLHGSADLDLGYGGAKLRNIQAGFKTIDIVSNYADVKLYFDSGASYSIDAETKYCPVKSPDLTTTVDIRKSSSTTLKGYHGSQGGGVITAEMDYGSLTIQ